MSAAQVSRAAFRYLQHGDNATCASGECAKVWVRVALLDIRGTKSVTTATARPPQSLPLKVVAPPPPAPPEDSRAIVLEVSEGEIGLRWLRSPSFSLSTVACSINPVVLAVL